MRLILVRHGESDGGRRGIIAGADSCTGLTSLGHRQATALANRFKSFGEFSGCHAFLSSPLRRARQTAEVLADAIPGVPLHEQIELCELQPGDADGLTSDVYRRTHGEFDMLSAPDRPFSPNGESWNDFTSRVSQCLEVLEERYRSKSVIAVTHSGFIVASIITAFGIPRPGTGARLDPGYTSLTEWQVKDSVWQLVRYNDMNHLNQVIQ